MNFIKLVKLMV